jgi:hypothetical protein
MKKYSAGFWIVIAAILVNGLRFVLIFLLADGVKIPASIENTILTVTGIATGVVLTGGGMYLAHQLAEIRGRSGAKIILMTAWVSLLVFSVILIAPALVLSWRNSPLSVIISQEYDWIWAVVAVVAIEVLAGAAMFAQALTDSPVEVQAVKVPGRFSILADAVTNRLVTEIAPVTQNVPVAVNVPPTPDILPVAVKESQSVKKNPVKRKHATGQRQSAKQRKHAALLQYLTGNPYATDRDMADAVGAALSTVQSYRSELEAAGAIHKNGNGWQVA